jgi:hypothetical protein
LTLAQLGKPLAEKVAVPEVVEAVGWNTYRLPATTLVGGVPDKVIAGTDVPAAAAAGVPVGASFSLMPHPASRAKTLEQTSKAQRNRKLLAVNIAELNYRLPDRANCRQ